MDTSRSVALASILLIYVIVVIGICILSIVAQAKMYKKAGKPAWGAIVPFYNTWLLYEITWGNGAYMFLLLIPFGNIIVMIATIFRTARVFGKGVGFGFGLLFLPIIFFPILGFGKAEYTGPVKSSHKGIIIASSVLGVLWFSCL